MQYAVFNPDGVPLESLPTIYGFHNGGSGDWLYAQLISEDGKPLGSHVCSHEAYMPGDLGCLEDSRSDRHDQFREYYPMGYKMEFVCKREIKKHVKLNHAVALAKAKQKSKV